MKTKFELDNLKKELEDLSQKNNDKISRSTVRKWMISSWIGIMIYLKTTLIKGTLKKHNKVQSMYTSVVAAIHNFLNYRIILELGLTNDEANTKYDQVLTKHMGRIYQTFGEELDFVTNLRKDLTINIKDNAGFLVILANLEVTSSDDDVLYDMDLKERRFFCMVKRDSSFIKYEKGCSISDIRTKYPKTNVELHGIAADVSEDDIVVFEGIDLLYRSFPADMSHGLKEMNAAGEFTIITVTDQKFFTGDALAFYQCRNSNSEDYQKAAEAIASAGVHNMLTKEIVDEMKTKITGTTTMRNSLIVWDGHPSTWKLASESNYQLLQFRHIDFNQSITKSIKEDKWASSFINNLIQISIGDNMFNITGSLDKLRFGITEDQKNLRESEIVYNDLVRRDPQVRTRCILTNGDVNISSKTEKSMRDSLGQVTVNGTHSMELTEIVTKYITNQIAFIKLMPESDHTIAKFEIIKELKIPKIVRSYQEDEDSLDHKFFIDDGMLEEAAKRVLIDNIRTEGPISSVSSIVNVKDLVSGAFGSVPPLVVMSKDDVDIKIAQDSFSPFSLREKRQHFNSGCVNPEEFDSSTVVKYYGNGKLFTETMDTIIIEMLNNLCLSTHDTDAEIVREYKPLAYQTFNDTINDTTEVFKTNVLRTNQYATILKIPRAEIHDLIYTYEKVEISVICDLGYKSIATLVIGAMNYNPYFYVMLGMKYDIDNRFSNEIVNVWDSYLVMLSPFTNLEKLIIHHYIVNISRQKLIDISAIDETTEAELAARKDKLLTRYKNRSAYYTKAIEQITDDMNDGNLDAKNNYIVETENALKQEEKLEEANIQNIALAKQNAQLTKNNKTQATKLKNLKASIAADKDKNNK